MRKILPLMCFLLILSCASTKDNTDQTQMKKGIENTTNKESIFEPIISSQIGGFTTPQIWVIKEETALSEIYGQINKMRKPGFKIPKVDFSKETIVAIFMGEKTSGGYVVAINEVVESENKFVVKVVETAPNPSDMTTMAFTQPFCIIKVNSATKNMVFEK